MVMGPQGKMQHVKLAWVWVVGKTDPTRRGGRYWAFFWIPASLSSKTAAVLDLRLRLLRPPPREDDGDKGDLDGDDGAANDDEDDCS